MAAAYSFRYNCNFFIHFNVEKENPTTLTRNILRSFRVLVIIDQGVW